MNVFRFSHATLPLLVLFHLSPIVPIPNFLLIDKSMKLFVFVPVGAQVPLLPGFLVQGHIKIFEIFEGVFQAPFELLLQPFVVLVKRAELGLNFLLRFSIDIDF